MQRLAAIVGLPHINRHYKYAVRVFGISNDLPVVHRAFVKFVAPFPGCAFVGRAEDTALSIGSFNGGVDHVWVRW